ncbi:prepilin-type N-terminal cleavage/methylation domain-containing protein [Candidatus Parcubacteria bacterium]|jgi:prepilin-type N-terminal cleavage/methylation domain-containing protein|nr:prepilin-type N-terminal cleavage/methylation domain-containing protein [Candidatus Parcubacteria bacterium]
MAKNNFGFTLVELLVVIAIIGILSSVAVSQLNIARKKAMVAAVEESLVSLKSAVILCYEEGFYLAADNSASNMCEGSENPIAGLKICGAIFAPTWPHLPDGWSYVDNCLGDLGRMAIYEFRYAAMDTDGNRVDCNHNGCITTP